MKNSNNDGFDQQYNAQAAVAQDSFWIVAHTLSPHPNDHAEAIPTLDAIPLALGNPQAGALDNGYFSATNIAAMEARDIEPYIATGRIPHHPSWQSYFAQQPVPAPADASPKVQMAYKLQTEIGGAIYRLRKCTVEPVLGIIKDILGFRQFSLRGLQAAAGEWCLVCIAFNLKRLHTLTMGYMCLLLLYGTGQGVHYCAQGPNSQQRLTHQDALGYTPVVFLGQMVDYGRVSKPCRSP
jgi:Transposase DDE domain